MSVLPRVSRTSRHRTTGQSHSIWCLIAVAAALLLSFSAAAQDGKKDKAFEDKLLLSADGWPLKLTYYKSTDGKEAAVVVLLHMKNESRMVWTAPNGFAEKSLQGKGFAVIALDLRKHGQSKPDATDDEFPKSSADKDKSAKKVSSGDLRPADHQAMVVDLEAVKRFIFEEHQKGHLNMRKTAIIAPTMSAAISVVFAANDWAKTPYDDASTPAARTPRGQDIQALVLMSPETNVAGIQVHQAAPALKATPLATLVLVGKTDPEKEQAKKLFQLLGGDPAKTAQPKKTDAKKGKDKDAESSKVDKQRHYYIELNTKLRGTELLGKKLEVEEAIVGFLTNHVQNLKGFAYEWRDRENQATK